MKSLCKIHRFYSFGFFALLSLLFAAPAADATEPPTYYYQLKVYHFKSKEQHDRLDHYLKDAYLPALHRAHIWEVGVFNTIEQDTADKRVYVFIPYKSWKKLESTDGKLLKDHQYLEDGKDYLDAEYNNAPYSRMEVIILRAFKKWKVATVPRLAADKPDRIYELRSYESPTEKYNMNKVKMFNDGGETTLFNRLNFNAVFYAEVLSGSHMPNLMYMTTFNSKQDRDKHWETFSNDQEWKALVALPQYQHNVSKADILFLHPTAYSDF